MNYEKAFSQQNYVCQYDYNDAEFFKFYNLPYQLS